jgi:D-3-phosphoglycerate dehydrogenase / 2-oxoglutarate reductase
MKILIADKFPENAQEQLKNMGHNIVFDPNLDGETLKNALNVEQPDVLIVRSTKVPKEISEVATNLKIINRAGAGYNTIDIEAAGQKGIAVCNCPGTNSIAVAELAMAHILNLDRRIADNVADLRNGIWNKKEYSKAKGLFGRTLGIVGIGVIGKEVAVRAKAFGMKVVATDPLLTPELANELGVERLETVLEVAKVADVITLHLPAIEATMKMINKQFFDAMKDGAYLVNTSRGEVIDQDALIEVLKSGKIRAGLDVYADEPPATAEKYDGPITKENNMYGTHHIGASTDQAQAAVSEESIRIIEQFEKEKTFRNCVNTQFLK